ncbi:MAG: glucose 1-dehydrogenase [Planctomycetia bacterium]|nr:glucose 1-dehydrogenase [Planctomycetia bacterium]
MIDLKNKKVLVTGSGTGLGRETALEFARRGAKVVLHCSHSVEGAQKAVEEIQQLGNEASYFQADFRNVEEVEKLVDIAAERLGGLDVLINNAGTTMTHEFERVTVEQFDTLYQINVRAQFFAIQRALPHLKNGGVVINFSSIHGLQACIGHSVYAGTKGAIIAQTRELAIELAPKGIRVNAIAPGAVPVENQFKIAGTDHFDMDNVIPCGFVGLPLDIANVACFLASDDARYIVGQTILVDGGTASWMAFNEDFKKIGLRLGKGYVPGI